MPVDVSCRQVFLASPGGLEEERQVCRKAFRRYNESQSLDHATSFFVHAWEDVPGGVGRPQDLINPKLDESDFLVLLLGDRWGTPPANESTYSSGTEEEFFRAIDLLADGNSSLRDILVLFKTVDAERLRDPGPSLQAVMNFRARLEASKSIMYEVFDSTESLGRALERKIRTWCLPLDQKVPRRVDIPEETVDTSAMSTRDHTQLVDSAREYAAAGLLIQAEAAYAIATKNGDPSTLLEFGQLMRRTGRLEQAMELNRKVMEQPELLFSRSADSAALRARATSNIGVIQRKQGEISWSLQTLKEAIRTAEASREPIPKEQCYALDNYGLSLLRANEPELALKQFEKADGIRSEFGNSQERAQSAINLARRHLAMQHSGAALPLFERALGLLTEESDEHLLANALCGKAEILISSGEYDEVDELLRKALSANEHLHNQDGLSIVHCLWARSFLRSGKPAEAEKHIAHAAEIVATTGNPQGRAVLTLLRADLARSQGDKTLARSLLAEFEGLAESADPSMAADHISLKSALQDD
ncbi:DUF4062 domain-containing protein [Terrabacter sp. 2TAF16]|uniref:DUF4062 domain-containing protein n=1 Tax=Terrabacter sp. 2TAF16 TaxID=3233008 RepID=UPI003F972A88